MRDTWRAVQPFSTGQVYVNSLGEEGDERMRAAYAPAHYARLSALKAHWDPTNRSRHNQNVMPAENA